MLSPKMKPFVFSFFIFRLFPPLQTVSATAGQDSSCVCCGFDGEGKTPQEQQLRLGVYGATAGSRAFPAGFVGAENGAVCWLIFVCHAMQLILSNTGTFTSQLCLHIG